MKRLMTAVFVSAAVVCYAAAEEAPDWLNGSSMEFPREKYITGVGMADDLPSAEQRARAEISRVFSTALTVTTRVEESETSGAQGASKTSSFSQQVGELLNSTSQKVLEGVEIAENWQNRETRQYYALAILDRAKAEAMVSDKINILDGQINSWKKEFFAAAEKFPRVKAAVKLLSLFRAKDSLLADLRVLDTAAASNIKDESALVPALSKAVAELEVTVSVKGENGRAVETGIIGALTGMGFQARAAVDSDRPADIIVTADVSTEAPSNTLTDDKWKWARSTATVALKDGKSGKIFRQFEVSERQASAAYQEAVKRSLLKIAQNAAGQTQAAVKNYFENQ